MKLTQRQVEVLRKLADGHPLINLDEDRDVFSGGERVTSKVLKPLYEAGLVYSSYCVTQLTEEGRRAAIHGRGYEGPAESPLNVQEYARMKVRVRRQMHKDGYSQTRSYALSDDPDECGILEWWGKGGELLLLEFIPEVPNGTFRVYRNAADSLAALGGSEPQLEDIPRRRSEKHGG